MTPITIMRDKFARSWPQQNPEKPLRDKDRAHVIDLGDALSQDFPSDAHFAAYRSPSGWRLNTKAIDEGVAIELTAIVFDVDCPETHGKPEPAPEEWRAEIRRKVVALAEVHPRPYYYETKGGARIVYHQAEPTILRTQDDAKRWSQVYAVAVAHLRHQFGIVADGACCDWQRLYRLPYATRTPGGRPENWPSWGDTLNIGTLLIDATHEDVAVAKRDDSRAFKQYARFEFTPGAGGDGLFYWLLRNRGDIDREARGGWIARCPNRAQHTLHTDGKDSTLCFPPALNKELGTIHCRHGHCRNYGTCDWLKFFSEAELEAARAAAGITTEEQKAIEYRELIDEARDEGEPRPRKWAAEAFRERFGHWPRAEWANQNTRAA